MIRAAQSQDLDSVRELFREYAEWVGSPICFESFAREISELPGSYTPPGGALLVAVEGGLAGVEGGLAGCAAFRPLTSGVCEMKRLYIRPACQGHGVGRQLVERIVSEAETAGYQLLRLDTLPAMERAISLYRALEFREIPPYGDNPPGAICFELSL